MDQALMSWRGHPKGQKNRPVIIVYDKEICPPEAFANNVSLGLPLLSPTKDPGRLPLNGIVTIYNDGASIQ